MAAIDDDADQGWYKFQRSERRENLNDSTKNMTRANELEQSGPPWPPLIGTHLPGWLAGTPYLLGRILVRSMCVDCKGQNLASQERHPTWLLGTSDPESLETTDRNKPELTNLLETNYFSWLRKSWIQDLMEHAHDPELSKTVGARNYLLISCLYLGWVNMRKGVHACSVYRVCHARCVYARTRQPPTGFYSVWWRKFQNKYVFQILLENGTTRRYSVN